MGDPPRNIDILFGTDKLELCGYPTMKKLNVSMSVKDRCMTDRQTDGRTDGHTDGRTYERADGRTSCDGIVCAMHSIAR